MIQDTINISAIQPLHSLRNLQKTKTAHPIFHPFCTCCCGCNKTTSFLSVYTPSTRHSLKKFAICLGAKLITATICLPVSSSFLYKLVICAEDFLIPDSPKS